VNGAELAAKLGGRACGAGWIAVCPAHDDARPSLALRDGDGGRVLVVCRAGCSQSEVIDALRARGLWSSSPRSMSRREIMRRDRGRLERERSLRKRHAALCTAHREALVDHALVVALLRHDQGDAGVAVALDELADPWLRAEVLGLELDDREGELRTLDVRPVLEVPASIRGSEDPREVRDARAYAIGRVLVALSASSIEPVLALLKPGANAAGVTAWRGLAARWRAWRRALP